MGDEFAFLYNIPSNIFPSLVPITMTMTMTMTMMIMMMMIMIMIE